MSGGVRVEGIKVELNEDEKEVVLKTVKEAHFAIQQLYNWLNGETLTEEMKETLVSLVDYKVSDIGEVLGVDTKSKEKVEEKHAEIRKANLKIRELEEKIGKNNPIEGLKEQLKALSTLVQEWWKKDGFGYVKNIKFTQYGGFEAELGVSFHSFSSTFSKTPASDRRTKKEWIQSLKDKGYQLYEKEKSLDIELIDCPENRELIEDEIETRFPSALVESWEVRRILEAPGRVYEILSIKMDIQDLTEIKALESYIEKKEGES